MARSRRGRNGAAFIPLAGPLWAPRLGSRVLARCSRSLVCWRPSARRRGVIMGDLAGYPVSVSESDEADGDGYSDVEVLSPEEMEELANVAGLAGTPAVIGELRRITSSGKQKSSMATLVESAFPFALDDFQAAGLSHLANGKSVIVSAPTGSGKTLVGEAAIYLGLASSTEQYRRRVFYTTPLKALSNQKFFDFKKQFGEERVGLLTGDTTVNRDAEILVMTTEVYRNMLYASEAGEQQSLERGYSIGLMEDLFAVVFDEFHFMNDKDRGTVWEESVIISPPNVLLVALSATIANTGQIRDWFSDVHGPTELVTSNNRPVPLRFGFAARDGLYPLFAKKKSPAGGSSANSNTEKIRLHRDILERLRRSQHGSHPRMKYSTVVGPEFDPPSFNYVVRCLRRQDLLPAIVFIFSRAGCDRAALQASKQEQSLVTREESELIAKRVDSFVQKHPNVVQETRVSLAKQGIASHHAGVLPLWKSVIEELFQDGLLKVIFATETLAAGINMPARTTVLSALSKRSDNGFARLSTSATLQMAGRAGRRGKDTLGNSLIMQSRSEGPKEAYQILTAGVDALESQFTPTYGMALNLLQKRSIDDIRELLDNSFGSFLYRSRKQQGNLANDLDSRSALKYEAYERARQYLEEYKDQATLKHFQSLRLRLMAARQALGLQIQLEAQDKADVIDDLVLYAPPGTSVLLENPPRKTLRSDTDRRVTKIDDFGLAVQEVSFREGLQGGSLEQAVLVGCLELPELFKSKSEPLYLCITKTNKARLVSALHVKELEMDADILTTFPSNLLEHADEMEFSQAVSIPPDSPLLPEIDQFRKYKGGQFRAPGRECTIDIAEMAMVMPEPSHNDLVEKHLATVSRLEDELRRSPAFSNGDIKNILSATRTVDTLEKDVKRLRNAHREMKGSTWGDFMAVTDLLTKYGFLERSPSGIVVSQLGQLGASVNAENEVWVSIVLLSNDLGKISPVTFVGVLSAVIAEENSRGNTFIGVAASEETHRTIEDLSTMLEQLIHDQDSFGLGHFKTGTTIEDSALPEHWASGASWSDMLSVTSLQEGDICRKLRRVMDLLRQIPRLPEVPDSVKMNAKRALILMNRFPIADDVTYKVPVDQIDQQEDDVRSFGSADQTVFEKDDDLTAFDFETDNLLEGEEEEGDETCDEENGDETCDEENGDETCDEENGDEFYEEEYEGKDDGTAPNLTRD